MNTAQLKDIAEAFKKTGTTTVEIGGGTNPDVAGSTIIEILKILKESGFEVWVNVGPALEKWIIPPFLIEVARTVAIGSTSN